MKTPTSLVWTGLALAVAVAIIVTLWPRRDEPPRGAFYFWQTTWSAATDPNTAAGFDRLYMRFFDVAMDEGGTEPVPIAPLVFAAPLPPGVTVVPVVYLANAVLRSPTLDVEALATKILGKVAGLAAPHGLRFTELQIDCDWSDATRARYFRLLSTLKTRAAERLNAQDLVLSATIRLHQIKYLERTGVPPVDRGMLMFYNMGTLSAQADRMSIFNAEDAEKYVAWVEHYPLALDVALPLFSWAIHQRGAETVGLLEGLTASDLVASAIFRQEKADTFSAAADAFFRGRYFRAGDAVRFETMTPKITRAAAALVARHQPRLAPFKTIAFFDLNSRNLALYETGFFERTLAVFR